MMVSPVYFLWASAILGQFNTVASVLDNRMLSKKGEDKTKKGCKRRTGTTIPTFHATGATEPGQTTTTTSSNFIADDGVQDINSAMTMCTVVQKIDGVDDVGLEICTCVVVAKGGTITGTGHTAGDFTYDFAITGGTGEYVSLSGSLFLTLDSDTSKGLGASWDALFCM
jgi:hypothetical protein